MTKIEPPDHGKQLETLRDFLQQVSESGFDGPVYVGVHTEKHPALGLIVPCCAYTAVDMPATEAEAGDYLELWAPFRERFIVGMEERAECLIDFEGIGYHVVRMRPTKWRQGMHLYRKDDVRYYLVAARLFPLATLYRKQHLGRSKALLMAEWLSRERNAIGMQAKDEPIKAGRTKG